MKKKVRERKEGECDKRERKEKKCVREREMLEVLQKMLGMMA